MIKKISFSQKYGFGTPETSTQRFTFWYYEYLKRNLLMYKLDLCKKIKISTINVGIELAQKESFKNGEDIVYLAIKDAIIKHYGLVPHKRAKWNNISNLVVKHRAEFSFLCSITNEYNFYAHYLVEPHDMVMIINHINSGKNIADIHVYMVAGIIDHKNLCINVSKQENFYENKILSIQVNLNDDFNIEHTLDDISFVIASNRHTLKQLGYNLSVSNVEMQKIYRRYAPPEMKRVKQPSDLSRAIGLWCWDQITGIGRGSKIYIDDNVDVSIPSPMPFDDQAEARPSNEELLFSLIRAKLLKKFHSKGSYCQDTKQNCLPQEEGKRRKRTDGKTDGACAHLDSCQSRVGKLVNTTKACIENKQIISIGSSEK